MATKIIKALVDGVVQDIEVDYIVSPEQPLSTDERLDTLEDKHEVVFTDGNFLVGNGTTELEEITPDEALSHIGGANIETMTTAEFEALEETNANTLYLFTDGNDDAGVTIDLEGATEGTPSGIDADTFQGYTIDKFVMYNVGDGSGEETEQVLDADTLGGKLESQLSVADSAALGGVAADEYVKKSETGMDLCWQNASPKSGFEVQTLNIDLSSYRWVIFNYKLRAGEPVPRTVVIPVVSGDYEIREPYNVGGSAYYESRTITLNVSSKTISVSKGILSHTTNTDNNNMIIPFEFIGIK